MSDVEIPDLGDDEMPVIVWRSPRRRSALVKVFLAPGIFQYRWRMTPNGVKRKARR